MSDGKHRFLHVSVFNVSTSDELQKTLEKTFDFATDWARYTTSCWILWTGTSAEEWFERISATPGLPKEFGVLIAPIELSPSQRSGKLYEWTWTWLAKKR